MVCVPGKYSNLSQVDYPIGVGRNLKIRADENDEQRECSKISELDKGTHTTVPGDP